MKRNLMIAAVFSAIFLMLCMAGCSGGDEGCGCGSLTVKTYNKDLCSCSDPVESGKTELSGCHFENSSIDFYWFPTACGYFGNDLGGISCVACGLDFTFLEFYGDKAVENVVDPEDFVSNVEERRVISAVENVDYTVDRVEIRMDEGDFEVFTDGELKLEDFLAFLKSFATVSKEVEIYATVQYTALTELHSVMYNGSFVYDGIGSTFANYASGFKNINGNTVEYNSSVDTVQKSLNIQPGKHVITASVKLNVFELLELKDINNLYFAAKKYAED